MTAKKRTEKVNVQPTNYITSLFHAASGISGRHLKGSMLNPASQSITDPEPSARRRNAVRQILPAQQSRNFPEAK